MLKNVILVILMAVYAKLGTSREGSYSRAVIAKSKWTQSANQPSNKAYGRYGIALQTC